MPTGKLVFSVRTATNALPVNSGVITLTNASGETVYESNVGESGMCGTATIESPPREYSLDSEEKRRPYSVFTAEIRATGYYRMRVKGIQIFENTVSRLPLEMIPLPAGNSSPESASVIEINIPEHSLDGSGTAPPTEPKSGEKPAVNILSGVYIPETVIVHLGAPDEEADDVAVSFIDYIKNVASSEIYPTWPAESLKANITAQISLTLNRIYTEWYRSRGYSFDITSSTAFDQAFVYGRNTYNETDSIVDSWFNKYIVRPNRVDPLYAAYCNGVTTTCSGMSQWGTVSLAESGMGYFDILAFYYGEIMLEQTNNVRAATGSYPGAPLSAGDSGSDVRAIQEQLNRIAVNYPAIPLITVSGEYGRETEDAVNEFQRLFFLPETGIVDEATWYSISYIYTSVKELSQITSEGQRASYNEQLYPGTPLRLYSRGSEVQEIQFYLYRISRFNPLINELRIDGVYGPNTENAVSSFEKAYGLPVTGVVTETVWKKIVDVYNGTEDNIEEPDFVYEIRPFPGTDITYGAAGDDVTYIQNLLSRISAVLPIIPDPAVDGSFGNGTGDSVNEFAAVFGLAQNGVVDAAKWNAINEIYAAVASGCIFSDTVETGRRDFPGEPLVNGSQGRDVRYVQESLSYIHRAIPYIKPVEADGIYGAETAQSVSALQSVFGISPTGRVSSTTWNLLNYIFNAVYSGCIPQLAAGAFAESKPVSAPEIKALMRENGIKAGRMPFFGLKSRILLAKWQAENGITPTGIPDSATYSALLHGKESGEDGK